MRSAISSWRQSSLSAEQRWPAERKALASRALGSALDGLTPAVERIATAIEHEREAVERLERQAAAAYADELGRREDYCRQLREVVEHSPWKAIAVSRDYIDRLGEEMGIDTGVDLDGLLATAQFCEQVLGRELHGRVTRSGLNPFLA